ncbi:MAG: hypothetical protein EXS14_06820 [Planctomycetes bacterium]|nr:hypothetical protein [Planctomycetota bacterium]
MDTFQATQGLSQPERLRELDARSGAYRQLVDASLKLHQVQESERLLPMAVECIRGVFGHVSGVIVTKQDGVERHYPFGGKGVEAVAPAHVQLLTQKSMSSLNAILDGQGATRVLAVPLAMGARVHGSLLLVLGDLEHRFGSPAIDMVGLVGRHLGIALDNAAHFHELKTMGAVEGEDVIPGTLSLCESKRNYERRLIRARLRESHGNIALAARSLNMDRGQLSRLLKKYAVDKRQYKAGRN